MAEVEELDIKLGGDISGLDTALAAAASSLRNYISTAGSIANQAGDAFKGFVQRAKDSGTQAADNFAAGFNSLNSKIAKTYEEAEKQQEKFEKGFGKLGDSFSNIGGGLTKALTAPLLLLGAASIETEGDIQALEKGFFAVYKGAGDAGDALKRTIELAKLPGLGLEESIKGSIRLQAVGFSAEQAEKSLRAFGNAVATTGGGKSELDRVTVQLGQLAAKGKVLSQDLRPIIEAAPLVAESLKKLYGTVDSEEISKKLEAEGKSSKEFVNTLTEELGKLPSVAGGLKNSLENIGDSAKLNLAKVGEALNKAFNIEGLINSLGDKLTSLAESFSNLSPAAQKTIFVMAGIAAAIGPVLVTVGALLTALPSLVEGFALVSGAVEGSGAAIAAFATGPVGIAIGAVAVLAAGLYYLITASTRAKDSYLEQAASTEKLTTSLSPLLARYDELKSKSKLSADEQKELSRVMQQIAQIAPEATSKIDAQGNVMEIATGKVKELVAAQQELTRALATKSLPDQQKELAQVEAFNKRLKERQEYFNKTGKFQENVGFGIKRDYTPDTDNVTAFRVALAQSNIDLLKQRELVTNLTNSVKGLDVADESLANTLTSVGIAGVESNKKQAETLAELKKRRDALKDKLDTLVPDTKAFADTKAAYIALDELIKKYEDTGKAAKKAADEIAKAFTDTNNKVSAVDVRVKLKVIASDDGLTEKIDALTSGIDKVTNLNVGVNDSRLKSLVSQLNVLIEKKQKLDASFGTSLKPIEVKYDVDAEVLKKIQENLDAAKFKANVEFQVTGDASKLARDIADATKAAQDAIIDSGVNVNKPQAKAITSQVKPLEIKAEALESLKEYKTVMADITAQQKVFGAGFNGSAAAMQATGEELKKLILLGQQATPEFEKLSGDFKKLKIAAEWDDLQNSASKALANLIADVGTTIADNLANVITGTASVGDAFANIFSGILGAVGGFLQDLGKQLIVYGLLNLAFTTLATNPLTAPAAIAIGAAAVLAGAVFKAASSKVIPTASAAGATSRGGGASYSPSTSTGSSPSANSSSVQNLNIKVTFGDAVLRAEGSTLVAVFGVEDYRTTNER